MWGQFQGEPGCRWEGGGEAIPQDADNQHPTQDSPGRQVLGPGQGRRSVVALRLALHRQDAGPDRTVPRLPCAKCLEKGPLHVKGHETLLENTNPA